MNLVEATIEPIVGSSTVINSNKKKERLPNPEPLVSIEDWTSSRLSRSGRVMDTLGAYVNIMIMKGHEIDTAANYEKGFLEFQNRPIEV